MAGCQQRSRHARGQRCDQVRNALKEARNATKCVLRVLPVPSNRAATGPVTPEEQRHLAQWRLQLLGAVMEATQAYDAGGRARAVSAIVKALAEAEERGVNPSDALKLVGWQDGT